MRYDLKSNKCITLAINFDPSTGGLNITGPIDDRLFCFGLLEMAKDALNKRAREQENQILVAAPKMPKVFEQ